MLWLCNHERYFRGKAWYHRLQRCLHFDISDCDSFHFYLFWNHAKKNTQKDLWPVNIKQVWQKDKLSVSENDELNAICSYFYQLLSSCEDHILQIGFLDCGQLRFRPRQSSMGWSCLLPNKSPAPYLSNKLLSFHILAKENFSCRSIDFYIDTQQYESNRS